MAELKEAVQVGPGVAGAIAFLAGQATFFNLVSVLKVIGDPPALPGRVPEFDSSGNASGHLVAGF